MLLGDVIARLDDEVAAAATLAALGDPAFLRRVEEAAARDGLTAGEFATDAIDRFSREASDEDWVSLIGAMGQTTDPGQVCLRRMVEFALRPPKAQGCNHGGAARVVVTRPDRTLPAGPA